jgi:hypothetical protein
MVAVGSQVPVAAAQPWIRRYLARIVKFSLKILGPLFVALALVRCGISFWTGYGMIETIQSTVFILVAVFVLKVLPMSQFVCSR